MLRRKEAYSTMTPIPAHVPRQIAIDILHSHSEVITLNPLVLSHTPITAPRDASADEYYLTWYEIVERIQWVPGAGRLGSGKISFRGCFDDTPTGLYTHIYAPMNIDLRNRYSIVESLAQNGAAGLCLREDIEIRCNVALVSYVKAQLSAASKEMVARIIKKAELLDAGVLHAMSENGRLKTFNPNDRSAVAPQITQMPALAAMSSSPQQSPTLTTTPSPSPLSSPPVRMLTQSTHHTPYRQAMPSPPYNPGQPATTAEQPVIGTAAFPAEMAGDMHHYQPSWNHHQQQQPHGAAAAGSINGNTSPCLYGGLVAGLPPAHKEMYVEYRTGEQTPDTASLVPPPLVPGPLRTMTMPKCGLGYNPQDYAT